MASLYVPPEEPRKSDGWLGFAAAVIVVYAVVVFVDAYARGQVIAWPF